MELSQSNFLDMYALCITETNVDLIDRKQRHEFLTMYIEAARKKMEVEPVNNTDDNYFYVQLLDELIIDSYTFGDKARLSSLISRAGEKYPSRDRDRHFVNLLSEILLANKDLSEQEVHRLFRKLRVFLAQNILNDGMGLIRYKLKKAAETTDLLTQETIIADIMAKARKLSEHTGMLMTPPETSVTVREIDLWRPESIKQAFEVNRRVRKDFAVPFGWQGLNEMTNDDNTGIHLGTSVLWAALTENFKSGILKHIARWTSTFVPPPAFSNRKPMLLFITLENDADSNLIDWTKQIYLNVKHEAMPVNLSQTEMSHIVSEHFVRLGWYVKIIRLQGSLFTADDYIDLHEKFKAEGYQIYATILDYLGNMKFDLGNSKDGSGSNPAGIIQTARRIRNYNNYNNILFHTGWQLDTAAAQLAKSGPNAVKKFDKSLHMRDCKGLTQEFEMVFFLHIESNADGQKFLTIRRDKGREYRYLTEAESYVAYPFTPMGILDDYGKATPGYTRNIHNYVPRVTDLTEDEDIFA